MDAVTFRTIRTMKRRPSRSGIVAVYVGDVEVARIIELPWIVKIVTWIGRGHLPPAITRFTSVASAKAEARRHYDAAD